MGADQFTDRIEHDGTAQEAFDKAVAYAQYEYGHRGYTGTIAEKREFVEIPLPEGQDPHRYALDLISTCDERINSKWGPAGCLAFEGGYLFFGWASS